LAALAAAAAVERHKIRKILQIRQFQKHLS